MRAHRAPIARLRAPRYDTEISGALEGNGKEARQDEIAVLA